MVKNDGNGFGCLIVFVIFSIIIWGIINIQSCVKDNKQEKKEKKAYEITIKTNTDSSYIAFMNEFKKGEYFKKVDSILWERTLNSADFDYYIKNVPKSYENEEHFSEANKILTERAIKIEESKWKTDSDAWTRAQEINTAISYKKYIEKYPNGIKIEQAKKLIIDREVDNIFKGDYGELPTMDKTSEGQGKTSNISVYNNTSYTLTLRYSGLESKKIEISSQSRGNITLKNGQYRIAASVNGNVRSFAGTENLTGDSYNVEYYIVTNRY